MVVNRQVSTIIIYCFVILLLKFNFQCLSSPMWVSSETSFLTDKYNFSKMNEFCISQGRVVTFSDATEYSWPFNCKFHWDLYDKNCSKSTGLIHSGWAIEKVDIFRTQEYNSVMLVVMQILFHSHFIQMLWRRNNAYYSISYNFGQTL